MPGLFWEGFCDHERFDRADSSGHICKSDKYPDSGRQDCRKKESFFHSFCWWIDRMLDPAGGQPLLGLAGAFAGFDYPILYMAILSPNAGSSQVTGRTGSLSWKEKMSSSYKGVLIEESLADKAVLERVRVTGTEEEVVTPEHQTPWIGKWTLHNFEVGEDEALPLAEALSGALDKAHAWYADFRNTRYHYIIFTGKIFKIDRLHPADYEQVVKYGLSIGIPDYQLDFSPQVGGADHEKDHG